MSFRWLALSIEVFGREGPAELELGWMDPLLIKDERDRLMAWQ